MGAADESGEGGVHRGEHLENQVVTGPQMGAFVGEYRGDLAVGQRFQRSLADHDAAAHPGQAIGERLFDIEDAQPTRLDTDLGWVRSV